jgi:hypothetical protein
VAFDFPASPSQGQVYAPTGGPAYQWDGEKWKGGQPSGPQTEQFFNLEGLSTLDIVVPSWAKMVELKGVIFTTSGTPAAALRISTDGTTFLAGASDYTIGGAEHASGSVGYSSTAFAAASAMQFSGGAEFAAGQPNNFEGVLSLSRIAGQQFHMRSYSKFYASASTHLYRTAWFTSFSSAGGTPPMTIKALRFMNGTTTPFVMAANSWLRVKWLGDAAQVPISNAIADAPSDGKPWVRRNGLWVKQTGVVQQKVFYDSTDFSRAATTEAVMSVGQSFQPLYPDSKVFWEWSGYATLTTTAAIDDLRGRLYGKYYDGTIYAASPLLGLLINGHVNMGGTALSSVFYGFWAGSPVDVSAYRRPDVSLPGAITIRLYGMADYASVTLDSYDCTMKFTEVLE